MNQMAVGILNFASIFRSFSNDFFELELNGYSKKTILIKIKFKKQLEIVGMETDLKLKHLKFKDIYY